MLLFSSHKLVFSYANVDYVVVRSTAHNLGPKIIASYDIMCQWATHLPERLENFPLYDARQLDNDIVARVVPKFHLAAHKPECRANFSLNFEPGVGRKDMEGPERTWFGLQGGGSTKDQGPGFWSDSMDNKFSHWNWTKLIGLGRIFLYLSKHALTDRSTGPLFKKKYLNALTQSKVHAEELVFLNQKLPEDVRNTWTGMIIEWERDRKKPNPYYTPLEGKRMFYRIHAMYIEWPSV
jgi:hypothetical protein